MYAISSSHFDNIDSLEETNAFRSSEPNRNDCWCLVPPLCPSWFKLSHIQPINIGFGFLNHHLWCFIWNLNKRNVKVKSVMCAWKQTQHDTFAWENSLKKHRKTHDWVLWYKTNRKQGWNSGTYQIKHWNSCLRVTRRCPGKINSDAENSQQIDPFIIFKQ